uniref:Ovule protein n=1 Tax=Meloidogyne incognita TaxID=6306 RepID=A0A914MLD4_MELIC
MEVNKMEIVEETFWKCFIKTRHHIPSNNNQNMREKLVGKDLILALHILLNNVKIFHQMFFLLDLLHCINYILKCFKSRTNFSTKSSFAMAD